MTGLEFLSALIGQLVWPIVVIALILIFLKPIKSLLSSPRLRRLKAGPGGIELVVDQTLDDAERELTQARSEEPQPGPSPAQQQDSLDFLAEMQQLARTLPRAVVTESHARLEQLLRRLVDVPTNKDGRSVASMRTLSRLAVKQGLLPESEATVLNDLSNLRNIVAHSSDTTISYDQAVEYAELIQQLAISLRLATGDTAVEGPAI